MIDRHDALLAASFFAMGAVFALAVGAVVIGVVYALS